MEVNYFTILYWFFHTSTWIHHGYIRVPHPEPPSHLPPCTIPLGHPSAPAPSILYHALNLDWRFISYMILYMFQCHSPKSSHPCPLPESKRLFYTSMSLLLSRIQGYCYHLSKFHIYALVYCIGFFFLAYFTLYNRLQFHPSHQNWFLVQLGSTVSSFTHHCFCTISANASIAKKTNNLFYY